MGSSLPDSERATFFHEQLMTGWYELLCCPSALGCTIVNFKPRTVDGKINPRGGPPEYKVKLRLSHSEHVPRYQLHMVRDGKVKQWIVGHMEKTETHLRAKPGEFIRIQVWKLSCNSMVMEQGFEPRKGFPCLKPVRRPRPRPSAQDMQMMQIAIATQAKLDEVTTGGAPQFDQDSVRWRQTIGVNDSSYKLSIEPPHSSTNKDHKGIEDINVMRILRRGKKVCVARKQRFAGALSSQVEQPYLGVQIKPDEEESSKTMASQDEESAPLKGLLAVDGLMLLLLCLAWSEETMSPHFDLTKRFIKAMYASPRATSDRSIKASSSVAADAWETEDVRRRLAHLDFEIPLHNWREESRRAALERKQTLVSVGSRQERSHQIAGGPERSAEAEAPMETAAAPLPQKEDDGGGVGPMEGVV
jgi:hypothetical protein